VLDLFLQEGVRNDKTWIQAQNWQLPDPAVADAWLQIYRNHLREAQESWERFVNLQQQVDAEVATWYGFNSAMQDALAEGLPWARKRRPQPSSSASSNSVTSGSTGSASVPVPSSTLPGATPYASEPVTNLVPVASSLLTAIGYDPDVQVLEVEFQNGDVYRYTSVPQEIYSELQAAPSKGSYYSGSIRGRYDGQKL
jgi:hypothetical protein